MLSSGGRHLIELSSSPNRCKNFQKPVFSLTETLLKYPSYLCESCLRNTNRRCAFRLLITVGAVAVLCTHVVPAIAFAWAACTFHLISSQRYRCSRTANALRFCWLGRETRKSAGLAVWWAWYAYFAGVFVKAVSADTKTVDRVELSVQRGVASGASIPWLASNTSRDKITTWGAPTSNQRAFSRALRATNGVDNASRPLVVGCVDIEG